MKTQLFKLAGFFAIALPALTSASRPPEQQVGAINAVDGVLVSTLQTIRPAGRVVNFPGRPVDMALDSSRHRLYIKETGSLVVVNTETGSILQTLSYPIGHGASRHGITVTTDGTSVFVTTADGAILEAAISSIGAATWSRVIPVKSHDGKGDSDACGIRLYAHERFALVCLSIPNELVIVDLGLGKITQRIPVQAAPYDVTLSDDEKTVFVSDWGGLKPVHGDASATSAGTPVRVDSRGVASSGCVSVVDLGLAKETNTITTGLHPTSIIRKNELLYTADANSDTISILSARTIKPLSSLSVHLNSQDQVFGSQPDALSLSPSGNTLYSANSGDNAVGVYDLHRGASPRLLGLIPTGWYPGAICCDSKNLFACCVKGIGSRAPITNGSRWNIRQYMGCVNIVPIQASHELLRKYTATSIQAGLLRNTSMAGSPFEIASRHPLAVPSNSGVSSCIRHVVYVIKENRTYDQLFGDLRKGNGDPSQVMYGDDVTPNHHALAEQFVLLDNYYCNGAISADGHSWATEGNCTDHLEKAFGGFVRSYTFGDDPLTYSSSGFIWDKVLEAGLTFRNFGEMDYASTVLPGLGFKSVYDDFVSGKHAIKFKHSIGIANLKTYTDPDYPGWNLGIPDVVRADAFLNAWKLYDVNGDYPALTIIYLPNDHTSGMAPGTPTPRAQVADNDVSLGRIVEGISHSRAWPDTCIFVNEDDPQDGTDHVDGHRSICLVISPWIRRHSVIHRAYNQTSVLHTMERMLGLRPMNRFDATAPTMEACFTSRPDLSPYTAMPNRVRLDELNPQITALRGLQRRYAVISSKLDFSHPDAVEDDLFSRILLSDARRANKPVSH